MAMSGASGFNTKGKGPLVHVESDSQDSELGFLKAQIERQNHRLESLEVEMVLHQSMASIESWNAGRLNNLFLANNANQLLTTPTSRLAARSNFPPSQTDYSFWAGSHDSYSSVYPCGYGDVPQHQGFLNPSLLSGYLPPVTVPKPPSITLPSNTSHGGISETSRSSSNASDSSLTALPADFLEQLPNSLCQLITRTSPHFIKLPEAIPAKTLTKKRQRNFLVVDSDSSSEECSIPSLNSLGKRKVNTEESHQSDLVHLSFDLQLDQLKYLKRRKYYAMREIIITSGATCQLKLYKSSILQFSATGNQHQVSMAIEKLMQKSWQWAVSE